jgi:hypothetical protein
VFVVAYGRWSSVFEGFVAVREDLRLVAQIDPEDPALVIAGEVVLHRDPMVPWIVDIIGLQSGGDRAEVIGSSVAIPPLQGQSAAFACPLTHASHRSWPHPVAICALTLRTRQLLGMRVFGSLADLIAAAKGRIAIDGDAIDLSLTAIAGEEPDRAMMMPAEHGYGAVPLLRVGSRWSAVAGYGSYVVRATCPSGRVGEALVQWGPGARHADVDSWGVVWPGDCSLEVWLQEGVLAVAADPRAAPPQLELLRNLEGRFVPPIGFQRRTASDHVTFTGLAPGYYRLRLVHTDGSAETREVAVAGQELVMWGDRSVVDVLVYLSESDDSFADTWGVAGGRLLWRPEGASDWREAISHRGASSVGWVIHGAPVDTELEIVACGADCALGWLAYGRTRTAFARSRVDLKARPMGLISGTIVHGDLSPAAGLVVQLRYDQVPQPWETATTDSSGAFVFVRRDPENTRPSIVAIGDAGAELLKIVVEEPAVGLRLTLP